MLIRRKHLTPIKNKPECRDFDYNGEQGPLMIIFTPVFRDLSLGVLLIVVSSRVRCCGQREI